MKSIAFGPYLGDFKYEVFYFLPYINWVKEVLNPERVYVSSHFNRRFLYKDVVTEFFDIDPILTADESSQKKHFNKNIFKNKYTVMEKDFISLINDIEGNSLHYTFDYSRFKIPCNTLQLKIKRLPYNVKYRYTNKVVYIPDRSEKEQNLKDIYDYLYKNLGDRLIVVGDKKTLLHDKNIVMSSSNYTSNVYEETVDAISNCKAVICPSSFWTGIANLQGKDVFSWGNFICEYKEGQYSFGNKGKFYPKLETNKIKKCLDIFLEEKC